MAFASRKQGIGESFAMGKTLRSLIQGVEILELRGSDQLEVAGVAYDSRKVEKGDVFVALQGEREDGHRFVQDAIARGAHAIVTQKPLSDAGGATWLRVVDGRKALAALAANFFENPSREFRLTGVTGTNGKTTSTLLLESIFEEAGQTVGVIGTLGYRWSGHSERAAMTTPESLDLQRVFRQMADARTDDVVMEVSSHALALKRVCGCTFRAAIFTNLSQDHLDFHHSMSEYFAAKCLLFKGDLVTRSEDFVSVINADDAYGKALLEEAEGEVWGYSAEHRGARVWVKDADLTASGITAVLSTPGGDLRLRSPLLGRLNLYNLLASTTTAMALGIPKDAVREGLARVTSVDGRLQKVPIPSRFGMEVVVDYAHTPDAMEKALSCLKEMVKGRLLVVFGCGGDRDRIKRPIMGSVAARYGDLVVLTSDNPRTEVPERILEEIEPGVRSEGLSRLEARSNATEVKGYTVEVDRRKAIHLALSLAGDGDLVYIGGKGHETYQIVGSKVSPFDDRQVVREYFESLDV